MKKVEIQKALAQALKDIRREKTLAGSVTNTVTMDFVANTQLAAGGAAAMVFMVDEALGLADVGASFYVNAGTILPPYEDTLPQLGRHLQAQHIPWVLDPVGIGMGHIRMESLKGFRETPPTILRANASEVIALASYWGLDTGGSQGAVQGVEGQDPVEKAKLAAISLAQHANGVVMVSGEVDMITDGIHLAWVSGGSPYMQKVTGFGCALGGLAAVYAGVTKPLTAALGASIHFKLAGARAEKEAHGPASFKVAFIDQVANLQSQDLASASIHWEEA